MRLKSGQNLQWSESLLLKIGSLILALILWITTWGLKKEEIRRAVLFQLELPPDYVVTNQIPSALQVTLQGPRILLRELEERPPKILRVLKPQQAATMELNITEDWIRDISPSIKILNIAPSSILVHLEKVIEREIPVELDFQSLDSTVKKFPFVFELVPATTWISGPKLIVDSIKGIKTDPINVHDLKQNSTEYVALVNENPETIRLSRGTTVRINIGKSKRGSK